MKLSLILQAIDRMSAPTRQAKASVDDLGKRGLGGLDDKIDKAKASAEDFGKRGLGEVDRQAGKAKAGVDDLGKRGLGALDRRIDEARGKMRGFGGDLDRGDRASKRLGSSLSALRNQGYGPLGARIEQTRLRLRRFTTDSDYAGRAAYRFGAGVRRVAERDLAALTRGAATARTAMRGLFNQSMLWGARQLGSAIRFGAIGLGAGAAAAGGLFARGVIGNAAKFEQYQVALEGTEGSAAKAKAAMSWVQKFAKATPYDIDTVTDAFVRARGVGIDPMTGAFRILGDAAGGTRKSLMDAVEAMADAQTGEFERLKEFNITTSVKGDRATFSYIDKAGKNATISVKKNMSEIRRAILDVFDKKYGGGMERQSKTLTGIWNNLQDVVTNFELKVADAGIFDKVKSRLQGVLDWTDKLQKTGQLDAWAKRASDRFGELWDAADKFITETDWHSVAAGIGAIVDIATTLVGLLGKAVALWKQLNVPGDKIDAAAGGWTVDSFLLKAATWDPLGDWLYGKPKVQSPRTPRGASRPSSDRRALWTKSLAPSGSRPSPLAGAGAATRRANDRASPWRRPAVSTTPTTAWPRASQGAPRAAPPPKPGKVAVDIRLSGPAASSAAVGPIKASGDVKATVNRGWAMGVHL